jgi:1-phosphofructokinase family hexose kinase
MIYTVTLNPTLDKTLSVPRLEPGSVHRARLVRQDLGGKGVNVSRALRALGVSSRLLGVLGGGVGEAMRRGLVAEGYDCAFHEVEGETRQNLTLFDEATGVYTKINEPGATVTASDLAALEAQVRDLASPGDLWAFSGSLPPGAPPDTYARLVTFVQRAGARAFLDTSEEALREGLKARPYASKPNSEEAAQALGQLVETDADHVAAARRLYELGVPLVCLSRGARGLTLVLGGVLVEAEPPQVPAKSPVGSGDAALAGLIWAAMEGCDAAATARRAAACGAAAAMQEGTGVGDRALVERLISRIRVHTLP